MTKLRVLSWNVNSVRRRLDGLRQLAAEARPDVICLQETKARDEAFPAAAVAEMGYDHHLIHGMKAYNGVAILSRLPLADPDTKDWCGRRDCRYAFARLPGGIELHNCYLPAGGDVADPAANPKFAHKLAFMTELAAWWAGRRRPGRRALLVGDLNVAPLETDVWSHQRLRTVVTHTPVEIAHLERMRAAHDWLDAVRHFIPPSERLYTWWSYRARDWAAADRGRRLDHVWVTPALAPALADARVLRHVRGWDPASDHAPVVVDLDV